MVREKKFDGKTVYLCSVCGLGYLDRETAKNVKNSVRKQEHALWKLLRKRYTSQAYLRNKKPTTKPYNILHHKPQFREHTDNFCATRLSDSYRICCI